jgi:poly(A) polymerase
MKEVWGVQPRFEQRGGQRPYRLLEHPRFRAAYDFLLLRAESGEVSQELADWWTQFQDADEATRHSLLKADSSPKPRRRKRKPAADATTES